MAVNLEQAGLEFAALAQRLRYAADTGLKDELASAVSDATKPVIAEIRAGLKPKLPDRYAEVLDADTKLGVSKRTTGSNAGVSIYAQGRGAVERRRYKRLDGGVLEHPLFGDRQHWFKQPVEPGWFTQPCRDSAPQMRDAILSAMHEIAQKITRG